MWILSHSCPRLGIRRDALKVRGGLPFKLGTGSGGLGAAAEQVSRTVNSGLLMAQVVPFTAVRPNDLNKKDAAGVGHVFVFKSLL